MLEAHVPKRELQRSGKSSGYNRHSRSDCRDCPDWRVSNASESDKPLGTYSESVVPKKLQRGRPKPRIPAWTGSNLARSSMEGSSPCGPLRLSSALQKRTAAEAVYWTGLGAARSGPSFGQKHFCKISLRQIAQFWFIHRSTERRSLQIYA
jgi:hypothetical protein